MFLVELSHNTIKSEIEELDNKSIRKKNALADSASQLTEDQNKLIKFVDQDNTCTGEKEKEAELQLNIRKQKEKEIKDIDSEIQNLKSEIEKNKDVLGALEDHKEFLINLPFPNLPAWLAE